jgi:hypothetical protein
MNHVDMDMAMVMMATSANMNDIINMSTMNRSMNPNNAIRFMAEQQQQDLFSYSRYPQFKSSYGHGYGYGHDDDVGDERATPTTPTTNNLTVAYRRKSKVSSSQPHGHGTSTGIGLFGRGSSIVSYGSASPLLSSPPRLLPAEAASPLPSATASTTCCGNTRHLGVDDLRMQLLQEEVGCLNDLGCRLFDEGHLQQSLVHFHHGLDRINTLSFLKRQQESRRIPHLQQAKKKKPSASYKNKNSQDFWLKACLLDGDKRQQEGEDNDEDCEKEGEHGQDAAATSADFDAGPALTAPTRPGSLLLPVDTSCHVWSNHGHGIHWETITSVALMHNASMVHFKAKSYSHARKLIDLARGLLKRSLTSSSDIQQTAQGFEKPLHSQSLNTLLPSNQYTMSVVVSLYIAFGHVVLKLPSVAGKYKTSQCQAQAKQAHRMASALLKRYNYKQLQKECHCQKMSHNMGMGMGINAGTVINAAMDRREEETKQDQLWQHHQRDLPPPPLVPCSSNGSSHNRYKEALQTALDSIIGEIEQEEVPCPGQE